MIAPAPINFTSEQLDALLDVGTIKPVFTNTVGQKLIIDAQIKELNFMERAIDDQTDYILDIQEKEHKMRIKLKYFYILAAVETCVIIGGITAYFILRS
jgi:hypothetical protein